MKLTIDGTEIQARRGASLLDLIRELGMDANLLSKRPLAAKIAGEVFTLNYIPLREKEGTQDRPSIRRAMAASGGEIRLLRYSDPSGKDAYNRTVQFVLFLALHQLWPEARGKMNCTVGPGLFIEVENAPDFSAAKLKNHVQELVRQDIPLVLKRFSTCDALAYFESM